jgi:hypothetical protein
VVSRITGEDRPDRLVTYPTQLVRLRPTDPNATDALAHWQRGARWLDILNVTHVWTPDQTPNFRSEGWFPRSDHLAARPSAQPRAWAVGAAQPAPHPLAPGPVRGGVLEAVEASPLIPSQACVVEAPPGGALPPAGLPGEAGTVSQLLPSAPEVVRLQAQLSREGMVVLSVPWSSGWRVSVDGGPAVAPLRVNGVIMGTPVAAGPHTIEWRYRTPGLTGGLWLAVLATLAAVAAIVWRRRGATPAPAPA